MFNDYINLKRHLFTKLFLNLSVFKEGNSTSCPLCRKGRLSLFGRRLYSALLVSFVIFVHNFISLSIISFLKSERFFVYPFLWARLMNLSILLMYLECDAPPQISTAKVKRGIIKLWNNFNKSIWNKSILNQNVFKISCLFLKKALIPTEFWRWNLTIVSSEVLPLKKMYRGWAKKSSPPPKMDYLVHNGYK